MSTHFIYTGSIEEGIKVASSPLEYDVMVILTGGDFISFEETRPCYAKLYSNATDTCGFHTKIINQSIKSLMTNKTINHMTNTLSQSHSQMKKLTKVNGDYHSHTRKKSSLTR